MSLISTADLVALSLVLLEKLYLVPHVLSHEITGLRLEASCELFLRIHGSLIKSIHKWTLEHSHISKCLEHSLISHLIP